MGGARTLLLKMMTATGSALVCLAPAHAAVRQCFPVVNATAEHPSSEAEARRRAMADWTVAANKFGQNFTRWQLADKRRIFCSKSQTGSFLCAVSGAPCTISQVPKAPPRVPSKGLDV